MAVCFWAGLLVLVVGILLLPFGCSATPLGVWIACNFMPSWLETGVSWSVRAVVYLGIGLLGLAALFAVSAGIAKVVAVVKRDTTRR